MRAIFRLKYPEWKPLDSTHTAAFAEEISIWGGQYFYESTVYVAGLPADARLVSGIVNLHSHAAQQMDTAGYNVLYTYDTQSENKDNLGMGILLAQKEFDHFITTPNVNTDVQNTYGVAFKPGRDRITYRFYAGWQPSDAQFASEASFRQFMIQEIKRSIPVKISWQ